MFCFGVKMSLFKWGMKIEQVLFSIVISVGFTTTLLSLKVEIVVIKVKGDCKYQKLKPL